MLDKVLRIALLYDLYGALLTAKQQRCLELHYLNDFSLAEIAAEFDVSRQAVHDILRRGEQILEEYEGKLGLAKRYEDEQAAMIKVLGSLDALPEECRKLPQLKEARELLTQLIDR